MSAICSPVRSWDDFPFEEMTGQRPNERDTAPARTAEGDFVLYHGSSLAGVAAICSQRELRPDDLGVVGVTTLPGAAQCFSAMKGGEVLRLVIDRSWLAAQSAMREIGGSGRDQWLIQAPQASVRMRRRWDGIPATALKSVSVYDFG